MLGYAESTDGIHFTKPPLGVVKNTNLCGQNVAGPSVFLNTHPHALPAERFVSVGKCHGDAPLCPHAWAWMTSPDGIHWPNNATHGPSTCAMAKSVDTQTTSFYDPRAGAYVSYTRDRYGAAPNPKAIRRVRRVSAATLGEPGRAYGEAECPWRDSAVAIDIDARDNRTHPRAAERDAFNKVYPPMDLYGAVIWPVGMGGGGFGASVYLAFPWRFWHFDKGAGPGTYDVSLMASRDGLNFSYVDDRRPFVRTGRDGTTSSRRVRVLPSPVVINDTVLLYMYLTNQAEMKSPSGGFNVTDGRLMESALGVVRMRRDGMRTTQPPCFISYPLTYSVPLF